MLVKYSSFGNMDNNCYLIVDEKTNKSALVDCTEYSEKMINLIGDTELEYILLTHGHCDHIAGAKQIKEKYNAKIVISSPDEPMLHSGRLSLAVFIGGEQNDADADVIVKDNDKIILGDTEISVISTPGHTKGSVCYLVENSLFSGDTLFYCSCGRTDFPGGSSKEMLESLKRLSKLDPDLKVYPGHDRATTIAFEKQNNPYMR